MKIVTKAFLRHLARRRSLSLLQVLGIGCGVAAVIGMLFSARAALFSFSRAIDFLNGKATHSLDRPAGPLQESVLTGLIDDPAVLAFSPVIDRRLRLENGESIRLLGIDPFLDRAMRPRLSCMSGDEAAGPWQDREKMLSFLLDPRAVLIDRQTASRLHVHEGSTILTSRGSLRVVATFPSPSPEPLIVMDIGHAQDLFGLRGQVDRVDLILGDEASFLSRHGRGFRVQSKQQKEQVYEGMLRAFRLNLEALSLIALFVGVFLVYNTTMFTVASRRKDAAILMSLGASRREIASAFLTEILIFGVTGGLVGGIARLRLKPLPHRPRRPDNQQSLLFPEACSLAVVVVDGCHRLPLRLHREPPRELLPPFGACAPRSRTDTSSKNGNEKQHSRDHAGRIAGFRNAWPDRCPAYALVPARVRRLRRCVRVPLRLKPPDGHAPRPPGPLTQRHPHLPGRPPRADGSRQYKAEPEPDRCCRCRLYRGPFHVRRSRLDDRELPGIAHLVDGYTAQGRHLHRQHFRGRSRSRRSSTGNCRLIPGLGGIDPYTNAQVIYKGNSISVAAVNASTPCKGTPISAGSRGATSTGSRCCRER